MNIQLYETATHAKLYAQYRPSYPKEVYRTIIKFCEEGLGNQFQLAIDVACGTGQSTLPLACHFNNVIGIDISEEQINQAPVDIINVNFRVGVAENLDFLKDDSVDLVTIAQALHWTDQEMFYSEVKRVLKPGGSCVVYGYGLVHADNVDVQRYFDEFFDVTNTVSHSEKRGMALNKYKDVELPFASWRRCDEFTIVRELAVLDFLGYVSSLSSWQKYKAENPDTNIFKNLSANIHHLHGETHNCAKKYHISWPVFILMGRKAEHGYSHVH